MASPHQRFHVGGPHLPAKRSSPSGPAGPSREDPNKVGTSVRTTGADQDLDKIEPDVDCRLMCDLAEFRTRTSPMMLTGK
jgi:hypothetical protein